MIKKTLLALFAVVFHFAVCSAQDVYNEIKNNAKATLADSSADELVRDINQFKVDALDYMLMKMREQMPDSTTSFLDAQAYEMNSFVNFYIEKILECMNMSKSKQVKLIKSFMDASYSNPLFNDPDTELTLCYFTQTSSLTRFSLDTDWRKAFKAIKDVLGNE